MRSHLAGPSCLAPTMAALPDLRLQVGPQSPPTGDEDSSLTKPQQCVYGRGCTDSLNLDDTWTPGSNLRTGGAETPPGPKMLRF